MTSATLATTPTRPLGVVVTGVDLAAAAQPGSALPAGRIADLLARHGVAVFPAQDLDDDAFAAFLRRLGPLAFTAGETPVPGREDLNLISNVGRATAPRSSFHVDTSYVRHPPAYTALRAVTVPAAGGETLFSDQYRAFETLPDDLRARAEGRTIRHVVTGVDPGPGAETEAEHPIFRPHPRSGRTALYLTVPSRCRSVSGLDEAGSAALVEALYAHSTRRDNVLRHRWAPGDVVIWDNGCVLHRADHADVRGDRVLHRGMVASRPVTP
jgi:taurine dioxygenase